MIATNYPILLCLARLLIAGLSSEVPACVGLECHNDLVVSKGGSLYPKFLLRRLSKEADTVRSVTNMTDVKPVSMGAVQCAPAPAQPMFLWVDSPTLEQTDHAHYAAYFAKLRKFMVSNCVGITVTRVVIRTPYPQYHKAYPTAQHIYWPPATSPLWTSLISALPKNVKFHIFPKLSDATSRAQWKLWGETNDVGAAVFSFANEWNKFLVRQGRPGIEGVVVDLEELSAGDSFFSASKTLALKARYPAIQFSATIGFDDVARLASMRSYTDQFFAQMYDWYKPYAHITASKNSPFLVNRNDPATAVNYITNTAMTRTMWQAYATTGAKRVHLMWSVQHMDANCVNSAGTGDCGIRNDFGSWSPVAVNSFIARMKAKIAGMGIAGLEKLEHGFFHYNSIPPSWL